MPESSKLDTWTELLAGAVVIPIAIIAWPILKIIDYIGVFVKN